MSSMTSSIISIKMKSKAIDLHERTTDTNAALLQKYDYKNKIHRRDRTAENLEPISFHNTNNTTM